MSGQGGTVSHQVKLLGILSQGSRAVFFPQCIAERKKSLLWDTEIY